MASAVEAVGGFWKRLLTSNFLADEASDKAGVVDLVGFVVFIDVCAKPNAEVDTVDVGVEEVDIGDNTDDLDDIDDLPLMWPDDDVVGAVAGRLPNETTGSEGFPTEADNGEAEVVIVELSSIDPKVTSVYSMSDCKQK